MKSCNIELELFMNKSPWILHYWKVACAMDQVMATGCVGTATFQQQQRTSLLAAGSSRRRHLVLASWEKTMRLKESANLPLSFKKGRTAIVDVETGLLKKSLPFIVSSMIPGWMNFLNSKATQYVASECQYAASIFVKPILLLKERIRKARRTHQKVLQN